MDKHDKEQAETANNEEKQAIINGLKAQLRSYTFEDSDEEIDAQKATGIVNLLKELDPIDMDQTKYNPQSGIERFWKHYDKKEQDSAGNENNNKKGKRLFFHKNRGIIGAVVAASLVFIVFWGTSGSTMAEDTGFFHWFKRGKTGQEGIMFPTQEETLVKVVSNQFSYSDDELPQQYKDEMWMANTIGENWEAQVNDVILGDMSTTLNRNYYNALLDQNMQIQLLIYKNQFMFERNSYADFTYLYENEVAGTTMFYFEKHGEDVVERAISFYQGTRCYRVHGDATLEKIEEIATDYAHAVLENNE